MFGRCDLSRYAEKAATALATEPAWSDRWDCALLGSALFLAGLGLVMVASAVSIVALGAALQVADLLLHFGRFLEHGGSRSVWLHD